MAKQAEAVTEQRTEAGADMARLFELSTRVARSAVAVIDTVVQRGAIKGEELSTIGQLRDQSVQLSLLVETLQTK